MNKIIFTQVLISSKDISHIQTSVIFCYFLTDECLQLVKNANNSFSSKKTTSESEKREKQRIIHSGVIGACTSASNGLQHSSAGCRISILQDYNVVRLKQAPRVVGVEREGAISKRVCVCFHNDDNKTDHVTLIPSGSRRWRSQNPARLLWRYTPRGAHTHYFQLRGNSRTRVEWRIPTNYVSLVLNSLFHVFFFVFYFHPSLRCLHAQTF